MEREQRLEVTIHLLCIALTHIAICLPHIEAQRSILDLVKNTQEVIK